MSYLALYIVHGLQISIKSMPVNLLVAGRGGNGYLAELLAGGDVRDVDLNLGDVFKAL